MKIGTILKIDYNNSTIFILEIQKETTEVDMNCMRKAIINLKKIFINLNKILSLFSGKLILKCWLGEFYDTCVFEKFLMYKNSKKKNFLEPNWEKILAAGATRLIGERYEYKFEYKYEDCIAERI